MKTEEIKMLVAGLDFVEARVGSPCDPNTRRYR